MKNCARRSRALVVAFKILVNIIMKGYDLSACSSQVLVRLKPNSLWVGDPLLILSITLINLSVLNLLKTSTYTFKTCY